MGVVGIEPTATRLKVGYSTTELHARRRFDVSYCSVLCGLTQGVTGQISALQADLERCIAQRKREGKKC